MLADRLTIVPIPSLLNRHWYEPVKPRLSSIELMYNEPFGNCTLQKENSIIITVHRMLNEYSHLNVSPTMPMSCPSGPRHRICGAVRNCIPSLLLVFASVSVPSQGNNTELPSGTITSCGSTLNFSAIQILKKYIRFFFYKFKIPLWRIWGVCIGISNIYVSQCLLPWLYWPVVHSRMVSAVQKGRLALFSIAIILLRFCLYINI